MKNRIQKEASSFFHNLIMGGPLCVGSYCCVSTNCISRWLVSIHKWIVFVLTELIFSKHKLNVKIRTHILKKDKFSVDVFLMKKVEFQ